jgi:hypothetical protein
LWTCDGARSVYLGAVVQRSLWLRPWEPLRPSVYWRWPASGTSMLVGYLGSHNNSLVERCWEAAGMFKAKLDASFVQKHLR